MEKQIQLDNQKDDSLSVKGASKDIFNCSEDESKINTIIIEGEMIAKKKFSLCRVSLSYLNFIVDPSIIFMINLVVAIFGTFLINLLGYVLFPDSFNLNIYVFASLYVSIVIFMYWYSGKNNMWSRLSVSPKDLSPSNVPKILSIFNVLLNNDISTFDQKFKDKISKMVSVAIKEKDKKTLVSIEKVLSRSTFSEFERLEEKRKKEKSKDKAEKALSEMIDASTLTIEVKSDLLVKALRRL